MKFERYPGDTIEIYKRMSPQQRLQVGLDLYKLNQIWCCLEVRHEHPDWEERQVQRETAKRMLLAAGLPSEHPCFNEMKRWEINS
jgi:hypothetical protein